MGLLDDLGDYLSSQGVGTIGTTSDWSIYLGVRPEGTNVPNKLVVLHEYGGLPSVHAMASGPGLAVREQPRVQVTVRGDPYGYSAARAQMQTIHHLLDGVRPRLINGASYDWIVAVQQPFVMEREANDRFTFACNYQVVRAP